jgi:hypothetical protein
VSSSQSSWLQIQRSGFDSRRYQIFREVMGLERVPLSLVSTTADLHGRKSSGSGLECREYGRRDPSRWPRDTLYPQNVDTNFADKRRSLDQYNLLADSGHGVCLSLLRSARSSWTVHALSGAHPPLPPPPNPTSKDSSCRGNCHTRLFALLFSV